MSPWPPDPSTPSPSLGQGSPSAHPIDWSSSHCSGSSTAPASSRTDIPEPGSVALLGPPGAGKTSFLVALARAFESGEHPAWTRFVPGRRLSNLLRRWDRGLTNAAKRREAVPPTEVPATMTLQLGLQSEVEADELEVSILDTPGAFFESMVDAGSNGQGSSPSAGRRYANLVRAIQNARCLVLCFPTYGGLKRWNLAGFVDQFLSLGRRRLPRVDPKPFPAQETPWERSPRLELPFERVLVLLSGIDTVCVATAQELQRTEAKWLGALPGEIRSLEPFHSKSPWEIAHLLDLHPLTENWVHGVSLLRSSLKPGARLAVCGISTLGMERPASIEGHWDLDETSCPPKQGQCIPFGIWESLLFMATGTVSRPVTLLDSDPAADRQRSGLHFSHPSRSSS